jgi:predicted SAM-dependent methyltransferase
VGDTLKSSIKRSPTFFHGAKSAQSALIALKHAVWTASRGGQVQRYLAANPERRLLQIGTGDLPTSGWLNTDYEPRAEGVIFLDGTRDFPMADRTFDAVYTEHVIEHVPFKDGATLLSESWRVLKPGGRIRIATPDLALLARLVVAQAAGEDPTDPTAQRYLRWIADHFLEGPEQATPAHVLNHNVRSWGHVFLYDEPTLRTALERAGFKDTQRMELGESEVDWLRDLETHGRTMDAEDLVAFETMVLEAKKPES